MNRKKLVVLVSGNGSNLQAILDSCQSGCINAEVAGVISNRPDAYALQRATAAGVPALVVDHRQFDSREAFERELTQLIDTLAPDLIVLAGFMRILTPEFTGRHAGKVLNIHPSLLPAYKGLNTHARVLQSGERYHGCSVHLVNSELDGGQLIAQAVLPVHPQDSADTLATKVHALEHVLYPRVLTWLCSGQLTTDGGRPKMGGFPLKQPVRYWFDRTGHPVNS